MEKKIYTDNFEQFLKDTADDFRMYPSKRVWNSIYNNLHPGKKWPSLAVSLLLVSSMLYIGIAHKNEITGSEKIENKKPVSSLAQPADKNQPSPVLIDHLVLTSTASIEKPHNPAVQQSLSANTVIVNKHPVSKQLPKTSKNEFHSNKINNETEPVQSNQIVFTDRFSSTAGESLISIGIASASADVEKNNEVISLVTGKNNISLTQTAISNLLLLPDNIPAAKPKTTVQKALLGKIKLNDVHKEWIEDYAFHNKPKEKWNGRLAYQFYATPSKGYRSLTNTLTYAVMSAPSFITSTGRRNVDVQTSTNQYPSLNMEAGGTLLYSFSKYMRLKAGIQLNYTNYKIRAFELKHTTSTTLLLADPNTGAPELVSRSSALANTSVNVTNKKLNSNTYQVSIPIGADIKLAGKNRLQWYAGGTVQPSYIVGGNGYLISSDLKNYVYDASFLRKWNLNAAVETFFSYKIKNGIVLNAGPQLRYQFLSTYKSSYSFDEKLYNLGVKMGITRNF